MKVAVSGANGFVGRALVHRLRSAGHDVVELVRRAPPGSAAIGIGDLADLATRPVLPRVDAVIHLAAVSVVDARTEAEQEKTFLATNVAGSVKLAEAAIAAGATRFVLLSSIKAVGEHSQRDQPIGEATVPRPETPYGRSKWAAEQGVAALSSRGMDYTIVRPPLVYGHGAAGNLSMLEKLVDRSVPLPIAQADNRRSLIYIGNLVDFLLFCLASPATRNQTFAVADEGSVSTAAIVEMIAAAKGKKARNFGFPIGLMENAARVLGKGDAFRKLFGDLEIDAGEVARRSGWSPPFSMEAGFAETFRSIGRD